MSAWTPVRALLKNNGKTNNGKTQARLAAVSHHACNNSFIISAHVHGEAVLGCLWDLVITALALHLAIDLVQLLYTCCSHWMTKRYQATTRIHSQLSINFCQAFFT